MSLNIHMFRVVRVSLPSFMFLLHHLHRQPDHLCYTPTTSSRHCLSSTRLSERRLRSHTRRLTFLSERATTLSTIPQNSSTHHGAQDSLLERLRYAYGTLRLAVMETNTYSRPRRTVVAARHSDATALQQGGPLGIPSLRWSRGSIWLLVKGR